MDPEKQRAIAIENVLIIEDHPIVAERTQEYLKWCDPRVNCFIRATADEARLALRNASRAWRCIILDLEIQGAIGLSFANEIHALGQHERCCIVTGREERVLIEQVHALGFLGYITKSTETEKLKVLLERVMRGDRAFPDATSSDNAGPVNLTVRQKEVLALSADGMSSKQIATALGIGEGTVSNYIKGAMIELGVTKRPNAVAQAIALGLIKMPPGPRQRGTNTYVCNVV